MQSGSYSNARDAVLDLQCVRQNEGKNLLLFFCTNETRKTNNWNPKAGAVPTPQAKLSAKAESRTFHTNTYKVLIGSECFVCYRIDVTGVTAQQNRYLCSQTAPAVVLVDKTGKVRALLAANQISESRVFAVMAAICSADRINLTRIVAAASSYAKAMYATETKLYTANSNYNSAKAKYEKKKTAMYKRKMDGAKLVLDQIQKQKDAITAKYKEAVDALLEANEGK